MNCRKLSGRRTAGYCVLSTVRDAEKLRFDLLLLFDDIRTVNLNPENRLGAIEEAAA